MSASGMPVTLVGFGIKNWKLLFISLIILIVALWLEKDNYIDTNTITLLVVVSLIMFVVSLRFPG